MGAAVSGSGVSGSGGKWERRKRERRKWERPQVGEAQVGEAQVGEPSCSSASRCLTAQGAVDVSMYPLFASARGTCVDLTGGALRPLPLNAAPTYASPT